MLSQFYNYCANTLLHYFSVLHPIKGGDRYSLFLEEETDLENLYHAIVNVSDYPTEPFSYQHNARAKSFESYSLKIGDTKLIIATSRQATENYLTTLRNLVDIAEEFKNTAIIILFSGKLDSLKGGSGDLTKSGMPFNFNYFSIQLGKKTTRGRS